MFILHQPPASFIRRLSTTLQESVEYHTQQPPSLIKRLNKNNIVARPLY